MTCNPNSTLSDRYAANDRTRQIHGVWNDVLVAIARAEHAFKNANHTKEADQLRAYGAVLQCNASAHCERLLANGYHKDSQADADSHLTPPVSARTVAVETELLPQGSGDIQDSTAAAPVSDVVEIPLDTRIQRRIEELSALAKEEQRYEVAIKFLYRARAMFESGTDHQGRLLSSEERLRKTWDLVKAAANVVEPMEVAV